MWKKTCRWLARQRKKQRTGSGRMTGRSKKISFKITLVSSWSSWYPFIYSFLLLLFSSCTSPTFCYYPANTLTQSRNSLWNTFDYYWFVWSNMYWFMSMVVESRLLQFVLLWDRTKHLSTEAVPKQKFHQSGFSTSLDFLKKKSCYYKHCAFYILISNKNIKLLTSCSYLTEVTVSYLRSNRF